MSWDLSDVDWREVKTPGLMESDEDLRRRLLYVAGDGPAETRRIHEAGTVQLEEIADRFGLRRRRA